MIRIPTGLAALLFGALSLLGCQNQTAQQNLPLATAGPTTLVESDYQLLPAGSKVTWLNLDTGKTLLEEVSPTQGLMMVSRVDGTRAYAYLPDPWADNENTREDDIKPLFPLAVGKKVKFTRHPASGLARDTVEVVRSETLSLPMGRIPTLVLQTHSEIAAANWKGDATFWYAPSLQWYVQMVITDTDGSKRRRQIVSISKP